MGIKHFNVLVVLIEYPSKAGYKISLSFRWLLYYIACLSLFKAEELSDPKVPYLQYAVAEVLTSCDWV